MTDRLILFITISLVAIAAMANLIRLFWNIPIYIGSFELPGWTGALFFAGLGFLAAWSFRSILALFPGPIDSSDH
jgi:hypothetical protein